MAEDTRLAELIADLNRTGRGHYVNEVTQDRVRLKRDIRGGATIDGSDNESIRRSNATTESLYEALLNKVQVENARQDRKDAREARARDAERRREKANPGQPTLDPDSFSVFRASDDIRGQKNQMPFLDQFGELFGG